MKKISHLFAVILAMTAILPFPAFAEEAPPEEQISEAPTEARPEDLYKFKINNAGRAEILDFIPSDSYQGELIIPDFLDGYEVGYIGNAAFMEAKGLTSITIPASVTDIGNSIFFGCTSLEKITVKEGNPYLSILDGGALAADGGQLLVAYPAAKAGDTYMIPGTVDEIAPGCFGFAQNLKEVAIPASVKYIDSWAFAYSNLEKINTASVMQIDEYGFAYCNLLHDVTLSHGLEIIESAAFSSCPALTQITLPDTLYTVGQFAFAGTGLTNITIPRNVTTLDYGAFGYDANLNPISSFVIYGEEGTEAQNYCTASDPDNDYQNHFTFIAVNNAEEPAAPEQVPTTESDTEEITDSETEQSDSNIETEEEKTNITESRFQDPETPDDPDLADVIAPEVKGSPFLQILLATVGGIAIILAIVLLILMMKKPRKQKQDDHK